MGGGGQGTRVRSRVGDRVAVTRVALLVGGGVVSARAGLRSER